MTAVVHHDMQPGMLQKRPKSGSSTPEEQPERGRIEQTGSRKAEAADPGLEEVTRGRRRSRHHGNAYNRPGAEGGGGGGDGDGDVDAADNGGGTSPDGDGATDGPSRKRRRSRKGLDKKFECPHDGCGKSYSRAEHLYRHQLNHTPKQIYNCDFPDCRRSFVRQDLCARHKERHTARGSQLQRKDAFLHNINPNVAGRSSASLTGEESRYVRVGDEPPEPHGQDAPVSQTSGSRQLHHSHAALNVPTDQRSSVMSPPATSSSSMMLGTMAGKEGQPLDSSLRIQTRVPTGSSIQSVGNPSRSDSNSSFPGSDATGYEPSPTSSNVTVTPFSERHTNFGSIDAAQHHTSPVANPGAFPHQPLHNSNGTPSINSLSLSSPHGPLPSASGVSHAGAASHLAEAGLLSETFSGAHGSYTSQAGMGNFSLPPPGYSTLSQTTSSTGSNANLTTSPPTSLSSMEQNPGASGSTMPSAISETSMFDPMNPPYSSMPVFGGDGYSRSPFAMADDFANWLFSDQNLNSASPMGRQVGMGGMTSFVDGVGAQFQSAYLPHDFAVNGLYPQAMPYQHPMAVTSILDTSLPESVLSEDKRQELICLIESRFNENDHAPIEKQKDALLDGNGEEDDHVLSLRMMQTYVSSFWYHFHPQLPLLHKPTFVADKTPNLLLIAMMAIGASCLDKVHGYAVTQAGAELSNFLAWYLRWGIFSDKDFRPPAKLWVFQALLLLEIYEKMYSTRELHERAHIHHATTVTLMRRGSSLIGKSALDSPPSMRDDKSSGGTNGSNYPSNSGTSTPEKWWNHWITNEATRRAAFAAFVMDSTHATMFGHNAVMVAHEMRLPLPCDEALWSATSSAEVGRIEASLKANGVKPTTFLEGLKKTLNAQSVRTNSFGRAILMAGLLSVSWHMNQRDLQVVSLGVSQALGGRDKWRVSLIRAFDFWQRDFDNSLAETSDFTSTSSHYSKKQQEDIVLESRTVLHHLAHMAMNVDIVDCQIFAGAHRLLGRTIGPQDYTSAQRRMKETWAPTAKARDATFYALKFLSDVLLSDNTDAAVMQGTMQVETSVQYSARDDFLINRPWVLYFAALIVWSYGYALEGRVPASAAHLSSPLHQEQNMRVFLQRVGGVGSPEDLSSVQGRNRCGGMLMVLRDMFQKTRWELLHEAANLLTNCVEMLTGAG
ncbi:MAG: hypothetical protein M1833_004953 [Piccolia ochrophora]|nr:MAG: hypothetical protein M1833_004953 [Piccolia ochrophora]